MSHAIALIQTARKLEDVHDQHIAGHRAPGGRPSPRGRLPVEGPRYWQVGPDPGRPTSNLKLSRTIILLVLASHPLVAMADQFRENEWTFCMYDCSSARHGAEL
jgi:hypothetical protein